MNQLVHAGHAMQSIDVVQARARIEAATTVEELRELQAQAEAIVAYLRSQGEAFEAQRREVESIRLDATRRLGELLRKQEKAKGGAAPGVGRRGKQCGTDAEPHSAPTLAEQGISKKLSATAQKLAAIPAEQYEAAKASLDVPSPSKVLDATSPKRTKLAERDAEVLRLWNEEKSPQEIAEILGINRCAVFASRRRLGLSRGSAPRIQSLSDDIGAAAHAWAAAAREWNTLVEGATQADLAECRKRVSAARTALGELRGRLEGK